MQRLFRPGSRQAPAGRHHRRRDRVSYGTSAGTPKPDAGPSPAKERWAAPDVEHPSTDRAVRSRQVLAVPTWWHAKGQIRCDAVTQSHGPEPGRPGCRDQPMQPDWSPSHVRAIQHNYIGTEHILLGLLREEEGLAARVLESLDITVERVRAQVVRIVGSGEEVTSGQIPFTPRAKKVLELALREALSLGHNYIGTEHILLGLVRENEGVAARILLDFDADSEKIRKRGHPHAVARRRDRKMPTRCVRTTAKSTSRTPAPLVRQRSRTLAPRPTRRSTTS